MSLEQQQEFFKTLDMIKNSIDQQQKILGTLTQEVKDLAASVGVQYRSSQRIGTPF